jgi:hypothetical protein
VIYIFSAERGWQKGAIRDNGIPDMNTTLVQSPRHEDVATERLTTSSRIFAFSRWDAIPVLAAVLHCA